MTINKVNWIKLINYNDLQTVSISHNVLTMGFNEGLITKQEISTDVLSIPNVVNLNDDKGYLFFF